MPSGSGGRIHNERGRRKLNTMTIVSVLEAADEERQIETN